MEFKFRWENIFLWISHRVLPHIKLDQGSCLGWQMWSTDKILKEVLLGTISTKWSANEGSRSRQEDFFHKYHMGLCKTKFGWGGHFGWLVRPSDKILKETQLRIIPPKFGSNWASSSQTCKFFYEFPTDSYLKLCSPCGGHLWLGVGSNSDIIIEETNLRTIQPKQVSNCASSSR